MVLTSQFEQGDREDHFPRRQFHLFVGPFFFSQRLLVLGYLFKILVEELGLVRVGQR